MDIYNKIVEYFEKPREEAHNDAPEGICSVCWGFQEYDHKIRILFEDKQIDSNNHTYKYMRVQKFLRKHIDGIKLKKSETHDCPTCSGVENEV